jgi:hypothetical protein
MITHTHTHDTHKWMAVAGPQVLEPIFKLVDVKVAVVVLVEESEKLLAKYLWHVFPTQRNGEHVVFQNRP